MERQYLFHMSIQRHIFVENPYVITDTELGGEKDDDSGRNITQYRPLSKKCYSYHCKYRGYGDQQITGLDTPYYDQSNDKHQIDRNIENSYYLIGTRFDLTVDESEFTDKLSANHFE